MRGVWFWMATAPLIDRLPQLSRTLVRESAVRRGTILAYGAMVGLGQLPAAVLGAEALAMRCFLAGSGLLLATAALVGTTYWRGLGGLVTSVFGIVWLILGGAMAS